MKQQPMTDFDYNLCIHQLFERCVAAFPTATALVFEEQSLTYAQLNERANQLAHYLTQAGIKPETWVGIHVDRSLEMIIGILAIFKAGGAYVPLDPAYPDERLSYMLQDTQIKWVLTQKPLLKRLSKLAIENDQDLQTFCLDRDWSKIQANSMQNLAVAVQPNNLAYVIYTSGSTGAPKGVLLEHRGLCNLAQTQCQCFGVNSQSRVLQFASLNFDASISEIVMALTSGASLYLGTPEEIKPGAPLANFIKQHAINVATLPPSALAVMPQEPLQCLHTLIVAGEACAAELANFWKQGRHFFNAYGPTETTVCATVELCRIEQLTAPPAIGYPLPNMQTYVLDQTMQPVENGEVGELYIGGIGVARGYHKRPDLSKKNSAKTHLMTPY